MRVFHYILFTSFLSQFTPRGKLFQFLVDISAPGRCSRRKLRYLSGSSSLAFAVSRIDFHTGICPGWCITEKPVLTANYQWPDAVLTEIITQAACTIFQIVHHKRTATIGIVDCLDQPVSGFRMQLVKP